jgi:hypothetical protein
MPLRQQLNDMVVVVPGIMGSTLVHDGREIWGLQSHSVAANLVSLGRPIRNLILPDRIGDAPPDDGVTAGALMRSAQIVPNFWNLVTGYSELVDYLTDRFTLERSTAAEPGNLLLFPYDWRLSNRLNAARLSASVVPALDRWRHAGHPDAKLVFVCHSMGGLIVRWFLEVLGGHELTKSLITIGTPYRGSIDALISLANGFAVGLGPLSVNLDDVLRSFPSVYQLLPTYECVETRDGLLKSLEGVDVPNVPRTAISDALRFHDTISVAAKVANPPYATYAIKGIIQPTFQSARINEGKVRPLRSHRGLDKAGDGTVPRPSSHPPEWNGEATSIYMAQKHGALQANGEVLRQIFGILTGDILGTLSGIPRIGLSIPDVAILGEALEVCAISEDGDDRLALQADLVHETGWRPASRLMAPNRNGAYIAMFHELVPGAYRITVRAAEFTPPVEEVTGLTLLWDPNR